MERARVASAQVRDLVQATEASETASIATRALRQQIEKLSAHLKQRDQEVGAASGTSAGVTNH